MKHILPFSAAWLAVQIPLSLFWKEMGAGLQAQPLSYVVDSASFNDLGQMETGKSDSQFRFADLNQDGHLDIVSIGDHGSPHVNTSEHGIMIFFGNGTGSNWNLVQNGEFGYGGCAAGDINNDGKQDLAYNGHHCFPSAVLGDGTGMNWTNWDIGLPTGGGFGTDLGDVNNDGFLDIASNSFGCCAGTRIYKNMGTGSWQPAFAAGVGGNSDHYVQFGDLNGDGNLDFVTSLQAGSAWFGNGTGGFAANNNGLPSVNLSYLSCYNDVSLGDIDNDGDDDFAFVVGSGIYVYKWNQATQQWDNSSSGLPAPGSDKFMCARFGDMDMDGYLDLLTGSRNNQCVQIWKGNGGASWANTVNIPVTILYDIHDFAIGDVDHSGYPDIFILQEFAESPMNLPIVSTYNKIKLLKDGIVPAILNATLTYPKGNECWPNNAVRFINWVSAIPGNHSSSVKIEYSTSGSSGPWALITSSAPNNGIYQWNVPGAVNSSNCHIRITATDNITSAVAVAINPVAFSMGCTSTTGLSQWTPSEQETAGANDVSIFPNPSIGEFWLSIPSGHLSLSSSPFGETRGEIEICNLMGEKVYTSGIILLSSGKGDGGEVIDLSSQPGGVYFLTVKTDMRNVTRKIIIQK